MVNSAHKTACRADLKLEQRTIYIDGSATHLETSFADCSEAEVRIYLRTSDCSKGRISDDLH